MRSGGVWATASRTRGWPRRSSCGTSPPRLVAARTRVAAAAEIAMAAEASGAAAAVSAAARAVMVGPAVTGEIVSGGLADPDTRLNAAKCLDAIACGFGGRAGKSESPLASAAARALLPWLPWLECDLDDDVVGPAASAAAAAAVRAAPADAWTPPSPSSADFFTIPRGERPRRRRDSRAPWVRTPSPTEPPGRRTWMLQLTGRRATRIGRAAAAHRN